MVLSASEAILPAANKRRGGLPPWALIAAAVIHLLPLLFLLHWPATTPPRPKVFTVTLVRLPPKPKPKPPPAVAPRPRESGPNQTTEAKKTAKPKPAPPPPQARVKPASEARHAAAVAPKPAPEGLRVLKLHLPAQGAANRNLAGDPYLNALMQRIERNRIYPPLSAFKGAVQRTVVYSVGVNPGGSISTITLLASSGKNVIDEVARQMIAASAPFPHLPADLPQIRTSIIIFIPVYPRG
jgi:protein TonB